MGDTIYEGDIHKKEKKAGMNRIYITSRLIREKPSSLIYRPGHLYNALLPYTQPSYIGEKKNLICASHTGAAALYSLAQSQCNKRARNINLIIRVVVCVYTQQQQQQYTIYNMRVRKEKLK